MLSHLIQESCESSPCYYTAYYLKLSLMFMQQTPNLPSYPCNPNLRPFLSCKLKTEFCVQMYNHITTNSQLVVGTPVMAAGLGK